jgi:glycosyltransferase involved in cell wall biosynthesis
MKVCHMTSVHFRYDMRINVKECRTLAENGHNVILLTADGGASEVVNHVNIISIKKEKGRLRRILLIPRHIYKEAKRLRCDVYHLHDPELIPIGLKLIRRGKRVIFDSHEDVASQILTKPYLPKYVLKMISWLYGKYERYALAKFDVVIGATPVITKKISQINKHAVNINNYPILGELNKGGHRTPDRDVVAYIGSISKIRGIKTIIAALDSCNSNVMLHLAGIFDSERLREEVSAVKGWEKVKELGQLGRAQVAELLARSAAGLVLFLPEKNHLDSQPNKMFEYMSAGVPVIASSFPLWKEMIEGNKCGICVNPEDPEAIAQAVDWVVSHPQEAAVMGENGIKAVKETYNWATEGEKLISIYELLSSIQ